MTAKITDDLQKAADSQEDQPVAAEHEGTRKVYYIYTEQMHLKASRALQEQEDWESVQRGLKDRELGNELPLAEADAKIRKELGFPPRV